MATMTSFHAEKCCHLVSEDDAFATRLCSSVCKFLIHGTFLLVFEIISLFSIICANVQKFNVESWSKDLYGQFYNGDSYIVLNVRK